MSGQWNSRRPARRPPESSTHGGSASEGDTTGIELWVESLPFCVRRPLTPPSDEIWSFAIDCEELDVRRFFLCTGLFGVHDVRRVHVVVPNRLVLDETIRCGVADLAPLDATHSLVSLPESLPVDELERCCLIAYMCAFLGPRPPDRTSRRD